MGFYTARTEESMRQGPDSLSDCLAFFRAGLYRYIRAAVIFLYGKNLLYNAVLLHSDLKIKFLFKFAAEEFLCQGKNFI